MTYSWSAYRAIEPVVVLQAGTITTGSGILEFKRRYDAPFVNEFISEREGMRHPLTASVRLKRSYRLAAPVVKPLVLARMRRYVVEPLKAAAEESVEGA
jgi:hypothetical protein